MAASDRSGEAAAASAGPPAAMSPWTPLRIGIFRAVWIGALASNLGTWMHLVAASWLMTSLTGSAAVVALIQTATALPTFALALPAGALADVLDRRRMIIATQGWQLVVAAGLGAATLADVITPASLLALTFALAIGAALGLPVYLSLVPELVPRRLLPSAISLNSAALTLAQAVGPILGGLLVASLGAGAVFLVNAASFLGVTLVMVAWRRAPRPSALPPEHVAGAVRTGVRYVTNARPLQIVLLRLATHVLFFSAMPALLVVVARTRLGLDAAGYGALLGCFGLGGASGALLLPRMRAWLGTDRLVRLGGICLALGLIALSVLESPAPLFPILFVAGIGSMSVLSSLSVAAQSVLPSWVRGRGLSVYVLTFQAGMAGGAALWGALAVEAGLTTAFAVAGAGVIVAHLLSMLAGLRLSVADEVDLTPAHWSEPELTVQPDLAEGPVLIEIEYRIAPEDTEAFVAAMRDLRRTRRRDGAMRWSVFQDLSDPERHVESFLVSSWAEHERQPERAVQSDRASIERVLALHRGDPPRVSHLLAHDLGRRGRR